MRLANVMFPTDFSAVADAALRVAVDVARESGARLHIVHVVPPVTDPGDTDQRLERLRRDVSGQVAVETASLSGRTATQIAGYARDKGIDLIVVGTHGRSGLSHAILGSVAEAVLRQAPCLVLSVPPRRLAAGGAPASAPAESETTPACIVCRGPSADLVCEECRNRIRAQALREKVDTEKRGR